MLVPTLRQHLPRTLALPGALFLGLRAFSLTVPALKTATATKTPKSKPPAPKPKKITRKDMRPPFDHPGTSWTNFVRELTKGKPGGAFHETEGVRLAARKWAQMSQEEKDIYAPTQEARDEYSAKRKEWKKTLPRAVRQKLARPKVPGKTNAYALFVKDNYDKSKSFADNAEPLKTKWATLSESEKLAYTQRAKEIMVAAAQSAQPDQ
ncbi:hypothetical protein D9619_010383 [Psilocybe cf. subviscida]|uniref:HMG box domain-containing protein n=1 Tax=Psilocybe cf. subviscida TaxID=2480587 RepID=A0A8H5AS50_9AGAR|nr:hypothetical protein D9619_010383 [Psilocybe cf. subviscida]